MTRGKVHAGPSGTEYVPIFIGRSGAPFPAGVEIHALVPAPLEELGFETSVPLSKYVRLFRKDEVKRGSTGVASNRHT